MWAKLTQNEPISFLFYNTFLKIVDNGSRSSPPSKPISPADQMHFFHVRKFISLLIL